MIYKSNPRLFLNIARKLSQDVRAGEITPLQVACVADGTDITYSHPVHLAITAELRANAIVVPSEHEMHERARNIAEKRAEDAPCFGGKTL